MLRYHIFCQRLISKIFFKHMKSILISVLALMTHLFPNLRYRPYSVVNMLHPAILTKKQTDTRGTVAIRSNAPFLCQSVAGKNLGNQAPDIVTCKYKTRGCQRYLKQRSQYKQLSKHSTPFHDKDINLSFDKDVCNGCLQRIVKAVNPSTCI